MVWRKHFSPVDIDSEITRSNGLSQNSKAGPAKTNYSSYLPDVYTGSPNRVERYQQYEVMDSDPEINAALDILAEFCTQKLKDGKSPFNVRWNSKGTNSEIRILGEYLQQWNKLQQFDTKIFRIVRNVFKYGDAFFIRDPETQKWSWVDPSKIVKIIVNESDGKKPEQYIIKDLAPNFENLVATQITPNINPRQSGGGMTSGAGYMGSQSAQRGASGPYPSASSGSRFGMAETEYAINAEHVVHLSLSEGLDNNYPFGNSLLENIFKVYKQKELLEDAILIYRIQRAPERRVFHIDVGNMPSHLAMAFVERVKNEIHQRRIPSQSGGGQNVIDSAYNPLCLDLATRIPLLDGRILELSELITEFEQGKENWAYSCNPETGKIVPGVINWAGITRRNTEVIKITFDNGETLICTPDHKIPVFGKGFIEAQHLTESDSLIAFNKTSNAIWCNELQQCRLIDEVIGEFFKTNEKHQESTYLTKHIGKEKTVIYHKNFNKFDHSPQNIMFMNADDYNLLMNVVTDKFWEDNIKYIQTITDIANNEWVTIGPNHKLNEIFEIGEYLDISKLQLTSFISVAEHTELKTIAVNNIEHVSNRDTGTITIDGTGQWHDYHTFAIESGIFVKNSINEDYFFPQTCLALDQNIKLLDGRDLQLADIIEEYNNGKENWAYAVNQTTYEIEPGKIVWAGKTRLNTQLVEVLLDNGKKIKVTPDHRFIMRDGSEVEAQYLKEHDSLMPLYLHDATTGKHQGAGKYLKYTCNATGKKTWVHTMVCPKDISGKDTEIHHIDCNSRNNSPNNLVEMNTIEHRKLHSELGTYHLTNAWNDPATRYKLVTGIRKYHVNATAKDKEMFSIRGKKNGAATWKNPASASRVLDSLTVTRKIVSAKKTIQYSNEMCNRVVALYNNGFNSISKLSTVLRTDLEFQTAFNLANPTLLRDKNRPAYMLPTDKTLVKVAQHLGYAGWDDFKKSYQYNHKVVSVVWLLDTEDTGDITIESNSNGHNFALTAGVFIHNSEGRGSKVDTLPGGTNLGEIDDLKFFTNKLFRGLRIPSSYLPTGADDSQASFNDGRVGTAYIQELRFNKYCERLQSLITEAFTSEFKMYMYSRGMNIDANLFELSFNPPMNFASARQAGLDSERINTFNTIQAVPYMSKRFALKRFLGLNEDEMAENERLWGEEQGKGQPTHTDAAGELRSAGLSAAGMEGDMGMAGNLSAPADMGMGMDAGMGSMGASMPPAAPIGSSAPPMG